MAHREFTDGAGRRWEAWEVHPTEESARREESHRITLAPPLKNGWLAFRSDLERRRLVPVPPAWDSLSDELLRHLLAQAPVIGGPRQ
jgi:hypothetical protein